MKAYPFLHKHPTTGNTTMSDGMDLRDWFAGLAMLGLLSSEDWTTDAGFDETAHCAYKQADAMIQQREVKEVPHE
jgi:hypothetical protein